MNRSSITLAKKNSTKTASAVFLLITLASLLIFSTTLQAMEKKSKQEAAGTVVAISGEEKPVSRAEVTGETFHGNLKSRVFHRHGCRNFNCKHCTAVFKKRALAMDSGYTPCKSCKP